MIEKWYVRLGCFLLAWLPLLSYGQSASVDDSFCRNGGFPTEQTEFALAQVVGQGKLHFLDDMHGCPRENDESCIGGAYVVSGDTVIVGRARGNYLCVFYPNKRGGTAGWVQASRLRTIDFDKKPALEAWAGLWTDDDDTLAIKVVNGRLAVNGHAYWPARNPPADQFPGGAHFGGIRGVAAPDGNDIVWSEDDCIVNAHFLRDLLIVGDNGQCGGMNVRFDGVYRRHR
jgi:hypothetical protein